jgi:predicted TIM-barrel fold metal-dependent hydrolase
VRTYGADRIVCGTDGTAFGVDWTAKALAEAEIGDEAREKILTRNAASLIAPRTKAAQREAVAA